jgi:phosphoribosylamine-glycine ligase
MSIEPTRLKIFKSTDTEKTPVTYNSLIKKSEPLFIKNENIDKTYIFITFDGASMPIAKQLKDEGNKVIVGQIQETKDLKTTGWLSEEEDPKVKKQRLSVYDGLLEKNDADSLLNWMKGVKDKNNYFVIVDHNNLAAYGEKINAMGFTGLIPLMEDFDREKDRKSSQDFVKKNYPDLLIPTSQSFKKVDDALKFLEDTEKFWVLKSLGNFGETVIPDTGDLELDTKDITSALENDRDGYEKGGFLLEERIISPIEFTPEIVFWNGKPIYSNVEIECKPIGAGDLGADGGGAINLMVKTDLTDYINEIAFPPIIFEMAKQRKGLFIFDCGILYDPKTKKYYFTEFAGNRWSWGGVFTELSMCREKGKVATNYFSKIIKGENPYTFNFGATVTMYYFSCDGLDKGNTIINFSEEEKSKIYLSRVKKKGGKIVTNPFKESIYGYVSGYGDTMEEAVDEVYETIEYKILFKDMLFRPKFDFLSKDYHSSISNRYKFMISKRLIEE